MANQVCSQNVEEEWLMEKMLDDVRKDAVEKLGHLGEEEKRQLIDAAILAMEFWLNFNSDSGTIVFPSRVEEEVEEKVEDELFKWIALKGIDDAYGEDFYAEMITSEYWMKNPQGIKAMVFCIYIYGTFYTRTFESFAKVENKMFLLLPKDCHLIFDKQMETIREQERIIISRKKKISRVEDLPEGEKETLEKLFQFHPVIKNAELIEKFHILEETIRNLTDSSIAEVINHMEADEYDCFYGLSNEIRKKIIYGAIRAEKSCYMRFYCLEHIAGQEKREEEELLGAVFCMLGIIKRLQKLERISVRKSESNFI